jgi:DNA helicase-2/ATP-dependent DNA helicase PcrA
MAWDTGLGGPFLAIAGYRGSPLWVLAGPGTGKTFALMRRVARILEERNQPRNTLVVTFTRTAAKDLVGQLRGLNLPGADRVKAGTLHSLCFEILNRARVLAITGRTPRTLADFENEFLLVDLYDPRYGGLKDKRRRMRAFEAAWARLQSEQPGWPREQVDRHFHRSLMHWLQFHESMLVGELVPETLRYLRNNPACQERRQFTHLLVDEYQDLNRAEQVLLDVLGSQANVCVVGDDDQSIYSFKYAHPEGIREFPDTHPGTHPEQLVTCRRCPGAVVEMASSLIGANPRINRVLRPRAGARRGEVWAVQWDSLDAEAEGLAEAIGHAIEEREIPPQEIMVLTARRRIGYRIRDQLRSRNLPVRSFFNEEALDNEASQERLVLLNLLVEPQDRVALRCWLGLGSRNGLPSAYARLREYAMQNNQHPRQTLGEIASGKLILPGTDRLVSRYQILRTELASLAGLTGVDLITAWLPPANTDLDELRAMALQVLQTTQDPTRIFEQVRYLITQPELPESPDSVRVMSLHKSKGLTARFVVLAGCVTGVIPRVDDRGTQDEQRAELEEQRRLFYVAITRTTDVLIISAPLYIDIATAHRIGARARRRVGGDIETMFTTFYDELGVVAPQVISGRQFFQEFLTPA